MSAPKPAAENAAVAGGEAAPGAAELHPAVARAARCVTEIMKRRRETLTRKALKRHGNVPNSLYASRIPDCPRQGVYEFTHPKDKVPIDWNLQALFDIGNEMEAIFKDQLRAIGMDLVEDQVGLSEDMRRNYNIGAYIDVKFLWEQTRIPVEMKMMSGFVYDRIDGIDFDDIESVTPAKIRRGVESMKQTPWTRKYLRQGTTYMLGTHQEAIIFALTDGRGRWKFVILEMDYEQGEKILKTAELIKKHVEAGTLPDRVPWENDICGRCPFSHICMPDIANDPSVKIVNNDKLHAKLVEWEKGKERAKKWEKLDKEIKATVRGAKNEILGDFVITDKIGVQKRYEIPANVKEQYRIDDGERHNIKIERIAKQDAESIYLEPRREIEMEE